MSTEKTSRVLRVCVVGVGHLGKIHARIYSEMEGCELVGLVDSDAERAGSFAGELGCGVFGSIDEIPDDIDAVSVVVPTVAHADVAVPLLLRGIPCLVEKPLAVDLEQADRILDAAEQTGTVLAVGHVERFQPGVRMVKEIGLRPRFIECHRMSTFSFRSMDIGVVHDLMIHDLDLVLHLMGGEVESIDAAGGAILTESEDMASVRLVFKDGGRANVTASRTSLTPMRRFRMFSARSYVSLDFTKNYGVLIQKGPGWEAGKEALRTLEPEELAARTDFVNGDLLKLEHLELTAEERPLQAELASYLDSVRCGTPPEVSGQQGRRALALAEDIVARIQTQAW